MRLLDGELAARDAREVRQHIEACWQCRRDLNEMQTAIDVFLRFREVAILPQIPPPPRSWPDLRGRCEDLDLAVKPRRLQVWRLALAAGVMGLVALAGVVYLRPVAPVVEVRPAPVEARKKPVPMAAIVNEPAERAPEISLPSVEVQVLAALHSLGADLGEAVEVTVVRDAVVVQGTALDPARAAAIQAALTAIPGVRWQSIQPPSAVSDGVAGAAVTPRPTVFGVRDDFANAVLDASDAITARAHALGRMTERFSGAKLAERDALIVRQIEDDHRQTLRQHAVQLQKLLAPLQVPEAPGEFNLSMTDAARELDELVSAGFGGAQSTRTDTEIVSRLLRVLREFER